MNIRPVAPSDAARIADIYNHYIRHTTISFEETPVSVSEIEQRIAKVAAAKLPWLVIEDGGQVQGYAYASLWRDRTAYRFTVEPSVYLDHQLRGGGLGKRLYRHLLDTLRQIGIEQVIGVIALPNPVSIALHEAFGFRQVGEFTHVGYKFDRWLSVSYWQLSLQHSEN